MSELSEAVKELRKALGVSQEKFAGRLGFGLATIQRWESGQFVPEPAGLVGLYFAAQEIERPDLMGVFARGRASAIAESPKSAMVAEALPTIDSYFARAGTKLTQAIANPQISNQERGALVGEALSVIIDGRQFIAKISQAEKETGA